MVEVDRGRVWSGRAIVIVALSALALFPTHALPAAARTKKQKAVPLATAATWVAVGPDLNLTPGQPAPEQATDPSAPRVMQIAALTSGLGFEGVGSQTFTRTAPDPSDPSRLVGSYIVKAVVFGTAKDAQKFRAADVNEVLGHGTLKKVGTYADGSVLDDAQGHINVMYTIGNVAVDVRTGVAETTPGSGVTDAKHVADAIVTNSKEKAS